MLELVAAELISLWPALNELKLGWVLGGTDVPSPAELRGTLGRLSGIAMKLGWKDLASQCKRLLERSLDNDTNNDVKRALSEDLISAFAEKTHNVHVIAIDETETAIFQHTPLSFRGSSL